MASRSSVVKRLLAAFLAIALVGALAGAIGMLYLGKLSGQMERMYAETTAPLDRLFSLYGDTLRMEPVIRGLGALQDVDANLALAEEKKAHIEAIVGELIPMSRPGEFRDSLQVFGNIWTEYKITLGDLLNAARMGNKALAQAYMFQLLGNGAAKADSTLQRMISEFVGTGAKLATASRGSFASSTLVVGILLVLEILASVAMALAMGRFFSRPLLAAVDSASRIADGELTISLGARLLGRRDEFGDLARALEGMSGELSKQISAIRASVDELAYVGANLQTSMKVSDLAAAEVAAAVSGVRNNVENQSAGVEETAATVRNMTQTIEGLDQEIERQAAGVSSSSSSIEQMVGNIRSVGEGIERLGSSFAELVSASEAGREKLEGVSTVVASIAVQSETLREANVVVSGIAAKTNLLAMNAAIEAAHAGDAGRGFAVVADEIRGLAESAAKQSKEISRDIGGIRKSIEGAVASSDSARAAFAAVSGLLGTVAALEREINASLAEQREGSRLALEGLASINEVTARVRAGSQELREGSKAIGTEMGELEHATTSLRDVAVGIERSASSIAEASASVSGLSARNAQAIAAVESLLSRYVLDEAESVADAGFP